MLNVQTSKNYGWQDQTVSAGVIMSELIKKVANQQDHTAFQEIFEKFGPRIKAYLLKQGADNATAEELVQETMLTVWRKASMFEESRGSLASWVYTIARNLRIDRLRKEKVWQELSEEQYQKSSPDEPADETVAKNQMITVIRGALKQLPPEQREIIEHSYLKGMSQSEIAKALNLPIGTVKSRMRLAYQKVRTSVEDLK